MESLVQPLLLYLAIGKLINHHIRCLWRLEKHGDNLTELSELALGKRQAEEEIIILKKEKEKLEMENQKLKKELAEKTFDFLMTL